MGFYPWYTTVLTVLQPSRTRIISAAGLKLLALAILLVLEVPPQKYGGFRMDNHGTSFMQMEDFFGHPPNRIEENNKIEE